VWPTLVLQQRAQAALREQPPDVAVLIDYPGVNLPLGRFLRSRGVRVIYYIPPNEWLWTEWRTAAIVSMCDVILCNYADEAEYFARNGGNTKLVGTRPAPSRGSTGLAGVSTRPPVGRHQLSFDRSLSPHIPQPGLYVFSRCCGS